MDNPADDRVTINVKSVSAKSWERAKVAANKQGQTMGEWLSRAINQLANNEAGPRELPALPAANLKPKTGNPGPAGPAAGMSAGDLADMMRGLAALATASGTPPAKADIRRAYGLADDLVRDARGMPRKSRPIGKASRQSLLENGKANPPLLENSDRQ